MAIFIGLALYILILVGIARAAENRSRRAAPWVCLGLVIGIFAFIPLVIAGTSREGRRQERDEEDKRRLQPAAVTQLKELGELKDAGVLTDEEFEAKKASLLDRI